MKICYKSSHGPHHGDVSKEITIRSKLHDICGHFTFISHIEPKNILEADGDSYWLLAMQEKLNQFEHNQFWHLTPRPQIDQLLVLNRFLRNKLEELENIVRNKARLVAQGYTQIEGINFEETFAHTDDTCFCFIQRF